MARVPLLVSVAVASSVTESLNVAPLLIARLAPIVALSRVTDEAEIEPSATLAPSVTASVPKVQEAPARSTVLPSTEHAVALIAPVTALPSLAVSVPRLDVPLKLREPPFTVHVVVESEPSKMPPPSVTVTLPRLKEFSSKSSVVPLVTVKSAPVGSPVNETVDPLSSTKAVIGTDGQVIWSLPSVLVIDRLIGEVEPV